MTDDIDDILDLLDPKTVTTAATQLGRAAAAHLDQVVSDVVAGPVFYDELPWYRELKNCTACSCRAEAQQVVPGAGEIGAAILILGRNPGKDEDKNGFPFMGRGGEELNLWCDKLGLDRGKILVSNLVKCHTTKDRIPKAPEIQTCAGLWLRRELSELPNLQAIVALGNEATQFLLGERGAPPGKLQAYVEKIRVNQREFHVIPVAHPAYFLRSQGKKFELYNRVLPAIREYLRRELPDAYERSAKKP